MSISIECLPTEILQTIFAYCTVDNLKTISKVCHRWTDAVQFLLLKWTCLQVCNSEEEYDGSWQTLNITMIDKSILMASNRKYTGLEVAWRKREKDDRMRVLKELCDVCQERFPVQRLYIRAPPDNTLVQFFRERRDWLENLTELDLELKKIGQTDSLDSTHCEILLPKLKRFRCGKSTRDANLQGGPYESSYVFTLNAPELCSLTVVLDVDCVLQDDLESRYLEPDVCCLFLPTLKLKTSSKLVEVVMDGCADINQRHIDNSEYFLKNLKVLELLWCSPESATKLLEKCLNLKELAFTTGDYIMYISPPMALRLERLYIEGCSLLLDDQTVFPKLKYFCLNMTYADENANADMYLVAPQLTTLIAMGLNSSQLIVHHKAQIRTMEVMLGHWNMRTNPPPPNVTELVLHWPYVSEQEEHNLVQDYLLHFPNLRRLNLYGYKEWCPVDLAELQIIPDLQFFVAHHLSIRLIDLKKFSGLKSLILWQCLIRMEPDDQEVLLPALKYCRVNHVTIDGWEGDRFPIRVDERQAPIKRVQGTAKGRNVFSSR